MYFRFIGDEAVPTFYAFNSAGTFVAAVKKTGPNSWDVVKGSQRAEEALHKGLDLEAALAAVELLE